MELFCGYTTNFTVLYMDVLQTNLSLMEMFFQSMWDILDIVDVLDALMNSVDDAMMIDYVVHFSKLYMVLKC